MPPHSRGASPESGSGSGHQRPHSKSLSASFPPTLRPYLENLPSPTLLIPSDQRTPTGPYMDKSQTDRGPSPSTPVTPKTPRRRAATTTVFEGEDRGRRTSGDFEDGEEEDDEDEEDEEIDVTGVTLDDDDFESHYSRHESEEESGSDQFGSQDEDIEEHSQFESSSQNGHAAAAASTATTADEQESEYISAQQKQRPGSLARVHSLPARPPLPARHHHQAQGQGLHTSQSTTSLGPPPSHPPPPPPLYPPFYNRPPTPLPPSPSLTSLLRPPSLLNRSTASTRPTTPDSSDVETPNDTEAAVAQSARRAHPLPPTSPKVPTYEYYGFVLYLASSLAFLFYILWSYLPSPFLHALGITYYPNRWWSLAIPAWIVMLLVYIYVALLSYNVEYLTLPLNSLECMVDDAANVAVLDEKTGRIRKGGSKRLMKELEERERYFEHHPEQHRGGTETKRNRRLSRGQASNLNQLRNNQSGGFGAGAVCSDPTARRRLSNRSHPAAAAAAASAVDGSPGSVGIDSSKNPPPPPDIPARDYQNSNSSSHWNQHAHGHDPTTAQSFLHHIVHPNTTTSAARDRAAQHSITGKPNGAGGGGGGGGPNMVMPNWNWKLVWNEGTDAVMDVPIGGVCEVLYG
ncbi:hypothetical protein HRR83_008767 [Exophiala dermatitidis]|uniref:Phosphatidylinositol glycan, class P n=2 Tax=Exophiala dermatitidis TaxID=5970 RepID=H6BX35_EXODN|nr:phosphatidylinositol glycan, class P [Exophiala dermatitidis NIH/UT8656]KAJ4503751.1 hypothetical protein HRR73_009056 [Exophiala dermatitidis]EHY55321.1 phosphatidylinositol glycan, class P [Exophiala dermatitidis NIH/UT8656]KAJ4508295.1 hypothetical protein HRR74_007694 [Exophiala dermatitidis]KAJ4533490.1 hypothetical protein HRR77_008650 [Exophiala dermatitidis]KAJ4538372.1 hypothetical protein HRR78_008256 [Exophiala dermatitidis]